MSSASKVFCAFLIFVGFLLIAVDGEPNLISFGQLTIGVGLLFFVAADLLDASRRTLAALLRFIDYLLLVLAAILTLAGVYLRFGLNAFAFVLGVSVLIPLAYYLYRSRVRRD